MLVALWREGSKSLSVLISKFCFFASILLQIDRIYMKVTGFRYCVHDYILLPARPIKKYR